MGSVVIAAHNEEAAIGRCLEALSSSGTSLDIVVVPNGCTDRTAEIARAHGVAVVEVLEPGKALALNVGDQQAVGFPRLYLDADIVVDARTIENLLGALREPGVLAAAPPRYHDIAGRPYLVRAYFAINSRLPAMVEGLFGRGLIAISAEGRSRFQEFPSMIADDLYLDSLFTDAEKTILSEGAVTIATPTRSRDLLRRLVRVRRGNAQLRQASRSGAIETRVRTSRPWSWFRDVVVPQPSLLPAGVAYAGVTLAASVMARVGKGSGWGRDDSSRRASEESEIE